MPLHGLCGATDLRLRGELREERARQQILFDLFETPSSAKIRPDPATTACAVISSSSPGAPGAVSASPRRRVALGARFGNLTESMNLSNV
jgi:hypothetical protein